MNITTIKDFIKWAEDFPYLSVIESEWFIDAKEDYLHYEYDKEYLPEVDWVYSCLINGSPLRKDGLVLFNIDNGCGETITLIFIADKEVQCEE